MMSKESTSPGSPIQESNQLLQALAALAAIGDRANEMGILLTEILEITQKYCGADIGHIYLLANDHYTLVHEASIRRIPTGESGDWPSYRMSTELPPGRALVTGEAIYDDGMDDPHNTRPCSAILPMIAVGQQIGVIMLEGTSPRVISQQIRSGLNILAHHAAALILGIRNAVQARMTSSQLIIFYVFGSRILGANSLPKVFELTTRFIIEATPAESVLIYLFDENDLPLQYYGRDRSNQTLAANLMDSFNVLTETVRKTRRPLTVSGYEENIADLLPQTLETSGIKAFVSLPMQCAASSLSGVLFVNYAKLHIFSSMELESLRLYADQLASVIDHLHLLDQSRQRQSDLEAVIDTAHILTSTLDISELLQQISVRMAWVANVDACSISTFDQETRRISVVASFNTLGIPDGPEVGTNYTIKNLPAIEQLLQGSGHLVVSTEAKDHYPDETALLSRFGFTTGLFLPISATGEIIGLMQLYSRQPGYQFPTTSLRRLRLLSEQVALALVNARIYQSEHRQRTLAEALREISLALSSSLNTSAVLEILLDQINAVIPYDTAVVMLVDGEVAYAACHRGFDAFGFGDQVDDVRLQIAEMPTLQHLANIGKPYFISDVRQSTEWVKLDPNAFTGSWMGAPLIARDRLFGFLTLDKQESGFYTSEHAHSIAMLTSHVALALVNSTTYGEVEHAAITDFLTGIYNHRHFQQKLRLEIERARRLEHPLSLLLIDIDFFKKVNDTYGHPCGDQILHMLSQRFKTELRGGDILARYGGEEFVVILPGVSGPTLGQVAERLLESVRHGPFFVDGNIIPLTVSGGGATFPHTAETAQELIANADKALYLSKKSGRNCYHYAE